MDEAQKQQNYTLAERLHAEQNFPAAVIAGAVAMVLAAAAYGMTVRLWPFAYGFAAAGIGIVVGVAMAFVGRGIAPRFAVLAAVFTLAGCLLGNIFAHVLGLAAANAVSASDVLRDASLSQLAESSVADLSPVVLLYWFVAVVGAVFLARRPLSRADRLAIGMYEIQD